MDRIFTPFNPINVSALMQAKEHGAEVRCGGRKYLGKVILGKEGVAFQLL